MGIYGNKLLNEGAIGDTLHKASFGFKIHPHQNIEETLKKHEYPGLLNFVKTLKRIDDLEYMRRDMHGAITTINKIQDKIEKGTAPAKFDGITSKDCNLTIKWYKEVYAKAISDRIKEIKEK